MANVLAPFGFMPVRRLDGAGWTGGQTVRKIKSTNTNKFFKGDVVKVLSAGNQGYIDVLAAGAATLVAGVFVGCRYLSTAFGRPIWSNFFPGGDTTQDVEAYIIDDPNCVFLAQTAGTSGAALGLAGIDLNFDINTTTAGNQLNGLSGMALDDNTGATTSTLPFRLVDVPGIQAPLPNILGGGAVNGYDATAKFNVVYVAFNNQNYKALTAV